MQQVGSYCLVCYYYHFEREKRGIADCVKGLFAVLIPQNRQELTGTDLREWCYSAFACIMDVISNCSNIFSLL